MGERHLGIVSQELIADDRRTHTHTQLYSSMGAGVFCFQEGVCLSTDLVTTSSISV
jgi:hypothetical protein